MPIRSQAGLSCPSSQEWALLAAGNIHGERAQALLAHVAECEDCGLVLKLASDAVEEDPRVETAAPPVALAHRLAGVADAPKVVEMPRRRLWPVIATIAAGVTLIVGGLALRPLRTEPQAGTLLAQAYTERRPFEYRLQGAAFAPVRVVRSSGQTRPKPLLDAEVEINELLARRPQDPAVLQLRAVAQLLEFEPAAASQTLEAAWAKDLQNLSLRVDLGIAYAQQSRWSEALLHLDAALTRDPRHLTALFNRALVHQRRGAKAEALADWDRYLQFDTTSGWAQEARDHRQALQDPAPR